jgi:hypothetical protein
VLLWLWLRLTEEGLAMTLPKKEEKGYLKLTKDEQGLAIIGQKGHIVELAAIVSQQGIPCHVEPGGVPGTETLVIGGGADPARVAEILESYKNAKGS